MAMAKVDDNPYARRAHYEPPWANTSIIGIAGSSGSGKTSLAVAIIKELNLPWVVILSTVRISSLLEAYPLTLEGLFL
jgi:DNA replication protein DnaC